MEVLGFQGFMVMTLVVREDLELNKNGGKVFHGLKKSTGITTIHTHTHTHLTVPKYGEKSVVEEIEKQNLEICALENINFQYLLFIFSLSACCFILFLNSKTG